MFHQVKIRKKDQDAQRLLFRRSAEAEIDTYVMQIMTFGATCSPACAQIVRNQNALNFKEDFLQEVYAIINNHYVDDYLDSFKGI